MKKKTFWRRLFWFGAVIFALALTAYLILTNGAG